MEDKEGKKQERGFAFWGAVISLILSALSIVLVVMEQYGVTLPGIMPDIMSWSLVWLPILCGVTGVFIGWYARDKKAKEEIAKIDAEAVKAAAVEKEKQAGETERQKILLEKEKREKQEKEEKKALELEQSKIDFIMTLEFESKKILLEILEKGQIKRPSLSRGWEGDAGFASWVKYEPIANGMDRWSLNPWAKEFLDEHPELLECVRVERETREKVEKSIKENGFQQTLQEVGKNIEWNEDGTMKL